MDLPIPWHLPCQAPLRSQVGPLPELHPICHRIWQLMCQPLDQRAEEFLWTWKRQPSVAKPSGTASSIRRRLGRRYPAPTPALLGWCYLCHLLASSASWSHRGLLGGRSSPSSALNWRRGYPTLPISPSSQPPHPGFPVAPSPVSPSGYPPPAPVVHPPPPPGQAPLRSSLEHDAIDQAPVWTPADSASRDKIHEFLWKKWVEAGQEWQCHDQHQMMSSSLPALPPHSWFPPRLLSRLLPLCGHRRRLPRGPEPAQPSRKFPSG